MVDSEKEEALSLQKEFEWVLSKEVHAVLHQLNTILVECARRFPLNLCGSENVHKEEKYFMSVPPDQLKCVVSLAGDTITQADINFRVQRQQNQNYRTTIGGDNHWKLHQIQDAANHLQLALQLLDNIEKDYAFNSSEEVLHILGNMLGCLQRGRNTLIVPRKKAMDELMKSRNMKSLKPNLPEDVAISFYIQSHKLVFAVYHVTSVHGTMKFDCHSTDASVPWLNEVLVLFTVALQLCQQLKDKICVFAQYKDFTIGSRPQSSIA
ncbi:protein rogdi [Macrosteles quadrilineatus]|uniref:protein rogdi n=1 Tax=Macrosteles quadrilineatus TaxID=74068 RepID=UPI0023E1EA07|nr:protein rogdi [Macrosteles quadrilineatus]